MPRPKTWKLTARNRHGRAVVKRVNIRLDISGFTDCAGFVYLVMAANPHLSAKDVQDVLVSVGERQWRSETWIRSRRWMYEPGRNVPVASADGLDERARQLLRDNPRLGARKMAALLRSRGIPRTPDWVFRSRNVP